MIVLSDEFYQEITTHPIPTDLEAVKVLAPATGRCRSVYLAVLSVLHSKGRGVDPDLWTIQSDPADRFIGVFVRTALPIEA